MLDIAGGKGELSFELVNLTGVRSTVIDPRPMRLDRYTKRYFKRDVGALRYQESDPKYRLLLGIYHRTGPWQTYNHLPAPRDASQVRVPSHIRIFFDDRLLEVLENDDKGLLEVFSSVPCE